jgi:hypothetical protein
MAPPPAPNSVDSSFIEREQSQKVPNQFFTVGIEAQRVTGEQYRIVVLGTKPEMTNNDHCRPDENGVQPLAFLQDPIGIFAVQERPLVPVQNRENLLYRG